MRAIAWCASNFLVFLAYFLIPNEIQHWRKAIPFRWTSLISYLFVSFIALCGLSHLVMIIIMPTGPWWAIWLIFVPLAFVSLATVLVIRMMRKLIIEVLQGVKGILDGTQTGS